MMFKNVDTLPLSSYPRYYVSILSLSNQRWLDACIMDTNDEDWHIKLLYQQNASCSYRQAQSLSPVDMMKYKYILSIGGTSGTSNSILWKLASSSVVLYVKSEFRDWYDAFLVPWKHYVPIASDLSDLENMYLLLESDAAISKRIIKNANSIASTMNNYTYKQSYLINLLSSNHLISRRKKLVLK